ncbi:MAG: superoxide dismutase [Armatimonadetes bacterium]|nr:superoxide dismutase [Armatimonadota bacterium]
MPYPKFEAKKFRAFEVELDGISKKAVEAHVTLYNGYVGKANEILGKLAEMTPDPAKANPTYSDIRVLKVELTRALGGVKNHEVYFGHLGGKGGKPSGKLLAMIERDFGSSEKWQADLKATGIAARGWAWTAFDWEGQTLFNFIGDEQNTYPVWNCTPLVALDVFEHAYFMDFGTNKGGYIDAFFRNLDWAAVEAVATKMGIPGLA